MVNLYRINSGSRKFGVDFVEVNWGNGLSIFGTFERKLYGGFQRLPLDVPLDPSTIALKYLEDHLLNASIKKTLNRKELKYVSRCILEALKVLHEDGYVHTGKRFIWYLA